VALPKQGHSIYSACESIEILDRRFAAPPDSFQVLDPMDDLAPWTTEKGDAGLSRH
jgi:hypothetical protein